jgi:hypothetical protein
LDTHWLSLLHTLPFSAGAVQLPVALGVCPDVTQVTHLPSSLHVAHDVSAHVLLQPLSQALMATAMMAATIARVTRRCIRGSGVALP